MQDGGGDNWTGAYIALTIDGTEQQVSITGSSTSQSTSSQTITITASNTAVSWSFNQGNADLDKLAEISFVISKGGTELYAMNASSTVTGTFNLCSTSSSTTSSRTTSSSKADVKSSASKTVKNTSNSSNRNEVAYKRFTNPRYREALAVGNWKVRKKISGGADAGLFKISSAAVPIDAKGNTAMEDVLVFITPPDYDNPTDANGDGVYEVTVDLINEDDGGKEIPVTVNQKEIAVPENAAKTVEIQSIGASPSQDTDGDGVPDIRDNSPLYRNANQADADGDGIGDVTDDDDQDGVWNPNDGCAGTALGARVDSFGCALFYLPTNNFSIAKTEKCVGTNSISIGAVRDDLTYNVVVSGAVSQTASFTGSTYSLENLSAGAYSVCLTVEGQSADVYQRCYNMTITEPQALNVYTMTDPGNNSVTFNLEGGTVYNITHNGMTTQTSESSYTVSMKAGMNTIDINTGIGCQGEYATTYFNSSPVDLAPNPFNSSVKLFIGGDDQAVSVSIFNMTGNQILKTEKVLEFNSRTLDINTTGLTAGTYLIKINGATTKQTFVAIKQ
jgi:hypothetical protein